MARGQTTANAGPPTDTTASAGGMTVQEAGRRGGSKVSAKYGRGFYQEIGHKGGSATFARHGHDFYVKIGHLGGTKGGARVRELIARGKRAEQLDGETD